MGLVWVSYLHQSWVRLVQIGVYLHQSWLRDCRLVFTTWQNCSISHLHKINPVFGDIRTPSHLMRVCFARVKIKLILPRFCWVYVNYTTHWAWSGLWSFPIYFPIWSQYWFRLSRTSPLSTVNPLPCAAKKRENCQQIWKHIFSGPCTANNFCWFGRKDYIQMKQYLEPTYLWTVSVIA